MSEPNVELKNIIEAALLVAGQPLTLDKILTMFPSESPPTREEIRAVLEMLEEEYAERVVELKQIDRSWRFQTREKYAPWVTRLAEERPVRYSRALLETLAIIAYRQPVTRGDIENIRGVSVSTEIIKTLVGREWIRQVGVRNVPGRPALYGTTREFLEHFNLKNLEELPSLSALRDLDVISNELNLRLDLEQHAESSRVDVTAAEGDAHGGVREEQESEILSEAKTAERE
ncbi:MAG: SMC-Scp complex subunit ScpB [Sulfuricaulis sp.]|nr:SMC-Scp complex subunit ScpB [Sulfuricaulis sp.]